jgi:hypothetical protein
LLAKYLQAASGIPSPFGSVVVVRGVAGNYLSPGEPGAGVLHVLGIRLNIVALQKRLREKNVEFSRYRRFFIELSRSTRQTWYDEHEGRQESSESTP